MDDQTAVSGSSSTTRDHRHGRSGTGGTVTSRSHSASFLIFIEHIF
jgi:hypothetical protein